jgi:hypothetical protein
MRGREWTRFWKEVMAQLPVEERLVKACEAKLDVRFPEKFRRRMMQSNGGLVRTGSFYWFIFPFPDRSHVLPNPIMWLARPLKDIVGLNKVVRGIDSFPPNAVAFGLRQFHSTPDGVLCFVRNENDPQLLKPEVWLWHWFRKPFKEFLSDASLLWVDDPFKKPKPAQNWKLKPEKAQGNTEFEAFLKTRRKKLSGKDRIESDWLFARAFPLVGGRVEICDCLAIPDEDTEGFVLGTGSYDMLLKVMTDSLERRISRLRLVMKGRSGRLGKVIRHVNVDGGAVSVFDIDPILGCDPEVLQGLEDSIIGTELKGLLRCFTFGPTTIAMISSGYGDGVYPVHALRDGEDLVGAEVEFLASSGEKNPCNSCVEEQNG